MSRKALNALLAKSQGKSTKMVVYEKKKQSGGGGGKKKRKRRSSKGGLTSVAGSSNLRTSLGTGDSLVLGGAMSTGGAKFFQRPAAYGVTDTSPTTWRTVGSCYDRFTGRPGTVIHGRQPLVKIAMTNGNVGAFATDVATAETSTVVPFNSESLNGPLETIMRLYRWYRFRSVVLNYVPITTTGHQGAFAMGINEDSGVGATTFATIRELGACCVTSCYQPSQFSYQYHGGQLWNVYVNQNFATASESDFRFTTQFILSGAVDDSAGSTATWGYLNMEYVLELYDLSPPTANPATAAASSTTVVGSSSSGDADEEKQVKSSTVSGCSSSSGQQAVASLSVTEPDSPLVVSTPSSRPLSSVSVSASSSQSCSAISAAVTRKK